MSVSIAVEPFSHLPDSEPFQTMTSVRQAYGAWRTELLQQICIHFGWSNPPWKEIDSQTEHEDSLMWSTYSALYLMAQDVAHKRKVGTFTHFLTRYDQGQLAIYLPVAFDNPLLINRNHYPEKATIASSLCLLQELTELAEFIKDSAADNTQKAGYAHKVLLNFAELSCSLALPIFLSW